MNDIPTGKDFSVDTGVYPPVRRTNHIKPKDFVEIHAEISSWIAHYRDMCECLYEEWQLIKLQCNCCSIAEVLEDLLSWMEGNE